MPTKINRYHHTKKAILELQEKLDNLSRDPELQREMEFEEKLRALMSEYDKSLRDINAILDPASLEANNAPQKTTTRRVRRTKRYTNPHTGGVIETRGGNHKELKEWKQQWGNETVESWAVTL